MDDANTDTEPSEFVIPEDLTTLDDADLDSENAEGLLARAEQFLRDFASNPDPSDEEADAVDQLADGIRAMRAEAQARAEAAQGRRDRVQARLLEITGQGEGDETEGADGSGEGEPVEPGDQPAEGEPVEPPAVESVAASAQRRGVVISTNLRRGTLNPLPSVQEIAGRAPDPGITDLRPDVVITAAADVPHLSPGQQIPTLDELVSACTARANALGISNGNPVFVPLASINRTFPHMFSGDMSPDQVMQAWRAMIDPHISRTGMEGLIAAGGWCAPSEIRYEFFQISEVAGLLDLPTFGVDRGGLRFPLNGGLSLYDFFALSGAPASGLPSATTMPWEWTEADDIATVTGTGAKACLRPPCPTFDEVRLRLFGICVTAGNLTEDAYPELIRHFIAQTVIAHARVINRRHIAIIEAASTATTPTNAAGQSPTNLILGGYELNAVDYRHKHGMSDTAVLEGVLPSWLRGLVRSDLAKRNGFGPGPEGLMVADAVISDFFDTRDIRMQWVQDWQTRDVAGGIAPAGGAIPTNWPTSAKGLLYAPGTFGRGNGMRLDLGVVRDSVLNSENDHTAAWSEEATMIAKFGHESRVLTFSNLEANGHSGDQTQLVEGP